MHVAHYSRTWENPLTPFEQSIRDITAVYRESRGLPPVKGEEIPQSIRKSHLAEVLTSSVLESGRVEYLKDPVAGLKRYEKNLREFNKIVDIETRRIAEREK